MSSRGEDLVPEEPPSSINPYEVLGIDDEKATADEIKSAYRKKALKHHPDKAPPSSKETAHKHFQEIAFAYAILSDPRRRRRYDTTGNTSESLNLDDDDFSWIDFFREQFATVVDGSAINKLKSDYQGSRQERADLLAAYQRCKGDLDRIYEEVMLSNVLDDDERFRAIITAAIESGEVEDYAKFSQESVKKREARVARAKREAEEAEELADVLGIGEKVNGKGAMGKGSKKKKRDDDNAADNELFALIQQRQKSRAATFLDDLEAKYASGGKGKASRGPRKRGPGDEPPEEAFAATASRKTGSAKESTAKKATTETKRRKR
ncbi:hypothetical protein FQN50_002812 [Emmonsiellopsis sp. PD_5]|nr:hypothetical protein FQN50_002812 [Emmonsiellopsis sp. PD_5]